MTLTPHNDFLTAFQGTGRGAKSMVGALSHHPGSRPSAFLMYQSLADESSEVRHRGLFLEGEINLRVNKAASSARAGEHAIPKSARGLFAPGFPNTHTTLFVSGQERSNILNFSSYYVNICEQIHCKCGFHAIPCSGPHISFPTH